MVSKYAEALMQTAIIWAGQSYCVKRQVGAVVELNGRIKSTGFNGTKPGQPNVCEDINGKTMHDKVIHAEINAMRLCSPEDMLGATMWCTCAPCFECSKVIEENGFSAVVYKDYYKNEDGINYLKDNGIDVFEYDKIT